MNGLRPVKYIADVLRKLVSGETDYMAFLPMNIAKIRLLLRLRQVWQALRLWETLWLRIWLWARKAEMNI